MIPKDSSLSFGSTISTVVVSADLVGVKELIEIEASVVNKSDGVAWVEVFEDSSTDGTVSARVPDCSVVESRAFCTVVDGRVLKIASVDISVEIVVDLDMNGTLVVDSVVDLCLDCVVVGNVVEAVVMETVVVDVEAGLDCVVVVDKVVDCVVVVVDEVVDRVVVEVVDCAVDVVVD